MTMQSKSYKVRVFAKLRADQKDAFRVHIQKAFLDNLQVSTGDVYKLSTESGIIASVTVWPAVEAIQNDVILMSKTLQDMCGLHLRDRVSLIACELPIAEARTVALTEISQPEPKLSLLSFDKTQKLCWTFLLKHAMLKAETLSPGLLFGVEDMDYAGQQRKFSIDKINGSEDRTLYYMRSSSRVQFSNITKCSCLLDSLPFKIPNDDLGGLDNQLQEINAIIATYGACNEEEEMPRKLPVRQRGLLLHGPSGTGKSAVLKLISEANWQDVFYINRAVSRTPSSAHTIQQIFADARASQPSLIVIDDLEVIAGKQEVSIIHTMSVGQTLCDELDQLGNARILLAGATTALSNIYQRLRSLRRFSVEIEIPVPTVKGRSEILKNILDLPKDAVHADLDRIASRTHGYVGQDLEKLLSKAFDMVKARKMANRLAEGSETSKSRSNMISQLSELDLREAFRDVQPSAMREISIETPQVRWSDIGGQEGVKRDLERAIIWPLKLPDEMKAFNIQPRKGLLLYGPPGCSKTMTAQALATESDLNFLAVKGAELLNMYVGESERRLRELFTKARNVSPSIIFFDEIDAIATQDSGHGGVQLVTTLLNELDGITQLNGVFVLAATNRPEVIHPALTRPGRLETMLYVGLPGLEARRHIVQNWAEGLAVGLDLNASELSNVAEDTDGCSGAEVVSICQLAGEAALDEYVRTHEPRKVRKSHFDQAKKHVQKNISPEMIASYEAFAASRHS